jgi:hypothetical protein
MLDPPKCERKPKLFSFPLKKENPLNRRNNVKAEVVVAPEINEALYSINRESPGISALFFRKLIFLPALQTAWSYLF